MRVHEGRVVATGSWGSSVHKLGVDGLGELARVDGRKDKYTWRVIAGGTSRNVCRETCAPCVTGHGLELTGREFRGRADKTPYRMFQIPGLGH